MLPTTQNSKCPRLNPKLHTTIRRKYDLFLKRKINKKQLAFIIPLGNCDGHTQSDIFVDG